MKRVVIVGGGFAGLAAAAELRRQRGMYVIVIDAKSYFEWKPGVLRRMVEPETVGEIHAEWDCDKVICGKVTDLSPHSLVVQPAEPSEEPMTLNFDYCAICTGSEYVQPVVPDAASVTKEQRKQELVTWQRRISGARSILIVGGGLVAVELAAEILSAYPGLAVTIATSKSTLLERMPAKAGSYAASWLHACGANIFYGMRMARKHNENASGSVSPLVYSGTSTNGAGEMSVEVDLAFECVGTRPTSSFMQSNLNDCLEPNGAIVVNSALQVIGHPTLFAAGDVSSLEGHNNEKMAFLASYAGVLVARNIVLSMKSAQLLRYPENAIPGENVPNMQVVSLARGNGILRIEGLVLCGSIIPPLSKFLIEYLSVKAIRGHPLLQWLWVAAEAAFCYLSLAISKLPNQGNP